MGIMSGLAKYLINNKENFHFQGNLLTLGCQTVFMLPEQLKKLTGKDGNISIKNNEQQNTKVT